MFDDVVMHSIENILALRILCVQAVACICI